MAFAMLHHLRRPEPPPPVSLAVRMRTRNDAGSGLVRYSFCSPEMNLIAETEPSTSATQTPAYEYVWFAGAPVAQIDTATSTTHWTFTDHLGTPQIQTNAAGAVDWRAEYEPYGSIFAYRSGATHHQPLRLPGQEYDEAVSGREYNIFRWYASGWGRYTQADPIRPSARRRVSIYDYARENPIGNVDSVGLYAVNGFNNQDAERLNKAIKKVWDFINTAPCNCLSKYPFSFRENMRSALIEASFKYDDGMSECGRTPPYVNIITLGPSAFSSCPPCLASTVLHELAHAAGATDFDDSSVIFGPSAYQIERECQVCAP